MRITFTVELDQNAGVRTTGNGERGAGQRHIGTTITKTVDVVAGGPKEWVGAITRAAADLAYNVTAGLLAANDIDPEDVL